MYSHFVCVGEDLRTLCVCVDLGGRGVMNKDTGWCLSQSHMRKTMYGLIPAD